MDGRASNSIACMKFQCDRRTWTSHNTGNTAGVEMAVMGFEVIGAVAVLTLDNPPVNSFGLELRRALVAGVARAEDDANVRALVITGSGKGFSGGADIREFGTPMSRASPDLLTVLQVVEDCSKPVIAAIGGICMGGGFELALACHYRLADTRGTDCATRGQDRPVTRGRRHATPAAGGGTRARAQHDRVREPGTRRGTAGHRTL